MSITETFERFGLNRHLNEELFEIGKRMETHEEIEPDTDHFTFISSWDDHYAFLDHWFQQGFRFHGKWTTPRNKADHISLIRGHAAGHVWRDMVGLSVPLPGAPNLVLDRALSSIRKPWALQHIAFSVRPEASMNTLRKKLVDSGMTRMTEVMVFLDPNGAELRQMFWLPSGDSGDYFFLEWTQRKPSTSGLPYGGFDTEIVDRLYDHLNGARVSLPKEVIVGEPITW